MIPFHSRLVLGLFLFCLFGAFRSVFQDENNGDHTEFEMNIGGGADETSPRSSSSDLAETYTNSTEVLTTTTVGTTVPKSKPSTENATTKGSTVIRAPITTEKSTTTTVSSTKADVTTVSSTKADITTVSSTRADITTVSSTKADITTVSSTKADITTVQLNTTQSTVEGQTVTNATTDQLSETMTSPRSTKPSTPIPEVQSTTTETNKTAMRPNPDEKPFPTLFHIVAMAVGGGAVLLTFLIVALVLYYKLGGKPKPNKNGLPMSGGAVPAFDAGINLPWIDEDIT